MRSKGEFLSQVAAATLCFSLGMATVAYTQSVGEIMKDADPRKLAIVFAGQCVQSEADIDKVKAAADLLEYIPLDEQAMVAFGAAEPSEDQMGWLVGSGDGAPYLLGVNTGAFNGRSFSVCTVSNPYVSGAQVVDAFLENAGQLELISDETRFGQRQRFWRIVGWLDGAIINSVEGTVEMGGGVTLSVLVPSR
ncbi:hypothetical protein ROA7745_02822 [Roseovarius aestuarii]|uniref:Uncharacterized protein n=3 Tax=Roseovarius aestuarii TaxID=475083 RepID=A0A1X7BTQ1_9RHOB|nr:hypothetical protein ROA7745_02822 [Roseovarius aestuarii]